MNTVRLLRFQLLFLACIAATIFTGHRLWVGLSEKSPTHFEIERLAQDYHGQGWIEVSGTLLPDKAVAQASNNGYRDFFVPMVSADYKASGPIQAVVCLSSSRSSLDAELEARGWTGRATISGVATDRNGAKLFPGQPIAGNVVYFYGGQKPDAGAAEMAFFGAAVIGTILCGYFDVRLYRRWKESRKTV